MRAAAGTNSRRSSSRFDTISCDEEIDPGDVAARPVEAGDEAEFDRIVADPEDDRDCRWSQLWPRAQRAVTPGAAITATLAADQIGHQRRQPVVLAFRPAIFDRDVAGPRRSRVSLRPLPECALTFGRAASARPAVEQADHRHRRLLRARRERPRRCRAAEQRDELAPLHSITSSASSCIELGTAKAKRICCLEVDHELKFRWLQNWQIGRLGAFEYSANVDASLLIPVRDTRTVADQAARGGKLAKVIEGRKLVLCR